MTTDPYGWRAHVADDWPSGTTRVILWRPAGDDRLVVARLDEHGGPVLERMPFGIATADAVGLRLPHGCAEAIAEAVKPGPAEGELARLQEALEVERTRVDRLLERAEVRR